jgi:hypothetical protein
MIGADIAPPGGNGVHDSWSTNKRASDRGTDRWLRDQLSGGEGGIGVPSRIRGLTGRVSRRATADELQRRRTLVMLSRYDWSISIAARVWRGFPGVVSLDNTSFHVRRCSRHEAS